MKLQSFFSVFSLPMSYFSSVGALNITITRPNETFIVGNPPSHSASDANEIVRLFNNLGRTTVWKLVQKVPFEGDTYEPEGMIRLGPNRYIVSAGEYTVPTVKYNGSIIDGTDRSPGAGFAHLILFDGNGNRIADATLTEREDLEYHNGGIDWDGEFIWATLAQYRPNTTATIVKIDSTSLQPQNVLHARDHLGGIVHDIETGQITALNWGARNASTWSLPHGQSPEQPEAQPRFSVNSSGEVFTMPLRVAQNPSFFVDYQDCKFLGRPEFYRGRHTVMLCGGVATITDPNDSTRSFDLGGLALVDVNSMVPLAEVPTTLTSDEGVPLTQNPVDVAVIDGRLRFYLMPDQRKSTLYVYEAVIESPYQY